MGKPNWRAGIALASQGLRQDREEKRAYERQDQEMAQQLYAKMLNAGMDVEPPENMGSMFKELANQWRDQLPLMQAKQLDDELRMLEESEYRKLKGRSRAKEEAGPEKIGPSDEKIRVSEFANMSIKDFDNLANDQRRELYRQYYKNRRKEEKTAKERRPREQIYVDDMGRKHVYNFETGEDKLISGISPEKLRQMREKIEKENKKLASDTYDDVMKMGVDAITPEILNSKNATLEGTGWQIRPVYGESSWLSEDLPIKGYKLKRISRPEINEQVKSKKETSVSNTQQVMPPPQEDPLGINQ